MLRCFKHAFRQYCCHSHITVDLQVPAVGMVVKLRAAVCVTYSKIHQVTSINGKWRFIQLNLLLQAWCTAEEFSLAVITVNSISVNRTANLEQKKARCHSPDQMHTRCRHQSFFYRSCCWAEIR